MLNAEDSISTVILGLENYVVQSEERMRSAARSVQRLLKQENSRTEGRTIEETDGKK